MSEKGGNSIRNRSVKNELRVFVSWSGLRLGEALVLSWDGDATFAVDFSHRRPMFRIYASAEKGNKNRVLPMAPEFAEFLQQVPDDERSGFVFSPIPQRNYGKRPRLDTTSAAIVAIGRDAGVKVSDRERGKTEYASAHDLRRSFGFRWAMRVMPPVLMQMMRHESIQTTQQFYVGRNTELAADALWECVSHSNKVVSESRNAAAFSYLEEGTPKNGDT